jgi:hypothetical protein
MLTELKDSGPYFIAKWWNDTAIAFTPLSRSLAGRIQSLSKCTRSQWNGLSSGSQNRGYGRTSRIVEEWREGRVKKSFGSDE